MRGAVRAMGRRRWVRLTGVGLVWTLLVLAFVGVFSWTAHADNHQEEADNYSLYQLASNGSTFTSEKNSPEEDEPGLPGQWHPVSQSPAAGGSLLAYADPEFSVSNAVGWLFAEVSGSSQTLGYDALLPPAGSDIDASAYRGLLDYAYFGAANAASPPGWSRGSGRPRPGSARTRCARRNRRAARAPGRSRWEVRSWTWRSPWCERMLSPLSPGRASARANRTSPPLNRGRLRAWTRRRPRQGTTIWWSTWTTARACWEP